MVSASPLLPGGAAQVPPGGCPGLGGRSRARTAPPASARPRPQPRKWDCTSPPARPQPRVGRAGSGRRGVMEAEDLQEELTCPICLDFFNDPVSIECGHNFCRRCLRRSWTPGDGLFLCPECRQPSSPAALRPNWALARLTEKTRRRRQGPVPPGLCGRHWEPLRLFCEDDQRPVCLVCRESQEHQDHAMAPVDEAFESYREKLLMTQCSLTAKMKKAMHLQDMEVKNATEWKNPKDLLTRSENQDVNYSLEVLEVKTLCHIPLMKEMLKRFEVPVSAAEDTGHPQLVFSQEGKYVKNGAPVNSRPLLSTAWNYFTGWRTSQQNTHFVERFQHLPCVLGKNVFTSGKHYWEVENRDTREIAVGVCQEDIMGIVDNAEMSPHLGIWAVCWSSAGYWPLTGSPVGPAKLEPALHRVGIFLDYGAGDISFYNAVDGVHLHTFSCSFVSCLRPFFWLSPLASLVIPPVTGGK
ncbi:E3 ubiquitin-protein ligase TRIM4 isoform X2 [Eptesicus fuscus]|uniref:E3 ubiquitin-protein ligase TRIM4 isoform X2 n=1 Tax=Eptesicus fuscus TaxID=29078 RepID=UPI0024045C81|nr:E3 ubiquitin-protein ligase TRIM4 isoform X2 [Eptesicus fuscus]